MGRAFDFINRLWLVKFNCLLPFLFFSVTMRADLVTKAVDRSGLTRTTLITEDLTISGEVKTSGSNSDQLTANNF